VVRGSRFEDKTYIVNETQNLECEMRGSDVKVFSRSSSRIPRSCPSE